jgi:hypothetical protein
LSHEDTEAFTAELERRLALMAAPDYEDPAREDFDAAALLTIAAFVVGVCLLVAGWLP